MDFRRSMVTMIWNAEVSTENKTVEDFLKDYAALINTSVSVSKIIIIL